MHGNPNFHQMIINMLENNHVNYKVRSSASNQVEASQVEEIYKDDRREIKKLTEIFSYAMQV